MIAIHPSHVATVNEVFTPSAETVAFDEGMVAAYEEAAAAARAQRVPRRLHIDKAHYDKAVEWLERAARLRGTEEGDAVTETSRSVLRYFEEFEVGAHYRHALRPGPSPRWTTSSSPLIRTCSRCTSTRSSPGRDDPRPAGRQQPTAAFIEAFHVAELPPRT